MGEEKGEQETPQVFNGELPSNNLRIGELQLGSCWETMDALIEKAKNLLKDKDVKQYLDVLKIQSKIANGSYVG